ncbi:hypothetical protein ACLOJK_020738 [Asimina triloba]
MNVFPCMSSGQNGSASSQESDREYTEGEEKEQSSPVSVLEPPFQDDLEVHESEDYEADEEEDEEGSFENNFAAIQIQQLLNKIQRFERLAELDPLDLEELLGEEGNEEEQEEKKEEGRYHNKGTVKEFQVLFDCKRMGKLEHEIQQEGRKYQCLWRIPCDVMTECWNDSKPNNSEDRVEVDIGRQEGEWRRNRKELEEIANDVEFAIFGVLIRDLSLDLVQSTC